jgi:dipeptidase
MKSLRVFNDRTMCDTLVALPSVTKSKHLLFAKNSDREPDEAQALLHVPRKWHTNPIVKCTFIEIPQVEETYECILSKPFQMWGAEMGANEWGVVIGNEAVFTKVKFEKKNSGLTGMDLLRLALERSRNANDALACITALLERYGQDACGGYKNKSFFYHNSFIIADAGEAWVLETAGRAWAAEKVNDIRSISNKLSIDEATLLSGDAKPLAKNKGWWRGLSDFSFQQTYSDWFYTRMSRAATRQVCTTELSTRKISQLAVGDCLDILQTHNLGDDHFRPSKANSGSVCMHATGLLNPSTTTGSMVAEIRSHSPSTIWLSGTSNPCLSVYIPFFMGTQVLTNFLQPSAQPDSSLWWRAERLHRWICKDYQRRKALIETERKELQNRFLDQEQALLHSLPSPANLEKFSAGCLQSVLDQLAIWEKLIR